MPKVDLTVVEMQAILSQGQAFLAGLDAKFGEAVKAAAPPQTMGELELSPEEKKDASHGE